MTGLDHHERDLHAARRRDDLDGRVAIVTGAGRGIGRSIAEALSTAGVQVAAVDLEPGSAADVATVVRRCDVRDVDQVDRTVRAVADVLGPVTLLVNNVGINMSADPGEMSVADYDDFMATDLRAAWAFTRAVVPDMRGAGRGGIVSIASNHAVVTEKDMYPYAAAKAGLLGLTRSLALELAPTIRVNAVCPGWTRTQLVSEWLDAQPDPVDAEQHLTSRLPLGRIADPVEVADVVTFLLGPGASAITGATVMVDGGASVMAGWAQPLHERRPVASRSRDQDGSPR